VPSDEEGIVLKKLGVTEKLLVRALLMVVCGRAAWGWWRTQAS
jgi:hypothetical protein